MNLDNRVVEYGLKLAIKWFLKGLNMQIKDYSGFEHNSDIYVYLQDAEITYNYIVTNRQSI